MLSPLLALHAINPSGGSNKAVSCQPRPTCLRTASLPGRPIVIRGRSANPICWSVERSAANIGARRKMGPVRGRVGRGLRSVASYVSAHTFHRVCGVLLRCRRFQQEAYRMKTLNKAAAISIVAAITGAPGGVGAMASSAGRTQRIGRI